MSTRPDSDDGECCVYVTIETDGAVPRVVPHEDLPPLTDAIVRRTLEATRP